MSGFDRQIGEGLRSISEGLLAIADAIRSTGPSPVSDDRPTDEGGIPETEVHPTPPDADVDLRARTPGFYEADRWWTQNVDDYWGPRSLACSPAGGGVGCDGFIEDTGDECCCSCHSAAVDLPTSGDVREWHSAYHEGFQSAD